jgi:hypothetical protein
MLSKALTFIHSLARKSLTKGQGSGITKIPSAMQAEAKASEIFTNLVEAGLKPEMMDDFIKSEADVAKYLNILDAYKRERMKPIPADSPRGKEITEALFGKRGTVVDMKGNVIPEGSGIMGGESIESLMKSGDVTKGTITKKSKKVTDRDMFRAANKRLNKPTSVMSVDKRGSGFAGKEYPIKQDVNIIIKNINRLDSIEAMKEANKIIKREGYYKNLSDKDAKKILQETEDHIFERNIKPKETDVPVDEDFASGGRVGLRYGGDTMGGINDKSVSSPGPDRSKVSAQQERSHQEAISRARDSQQYDYTVPKQIVKDIAINTGKNLAGQKIASVLGIGTGPIGIMLALKGLYDQTRNPVYSEEDLTYGVPYQTGGRVGLKGGGRTITLMDGTKVYIPEGSTTSSGGLKDRIYSSSKGDLLREDIVRLMSFESGGRVGLRGGGADFIPTEKMNTDRMKVIREFLKRKIPHLDSGPIDKSILYDLQEALSSGSGLFPGYDVRNDLPREVEAKGGGRIGLAGGMTRRAFLKLMGGVAAGIGAIKSGIMGVGKKGVAKKVVKEVIKTPPVAGKPEWFDALINKVILEGDDVTKKLATKDREIVHTKKLNDQESVTVTQDLDDGAIRVEYDSPDNLGQEPVMMQFKPGRADETTGGKKPADRFDVVETEPRYVGPDNTDIEFIGESGGPNISFIESDVTNLKTFATGKGPTMKEIVKSKKRKDLTRAVNENDYEAAEYLGGKYGDVPEPDFPDDYSGYASGGLAYMLGE